MIETYDTRSFSSWAPDATPCQARRILIACAGVGMGNASRVVAIIEELGALAARDAQPLQIHVFSWGAGYKFLAHYRAETGASFGLTEGEAYAHWLRAPAAYARNVRSLARLARAWPPTLIVLDSDYHFPAFVGTRAPVISIGQAHDVVLRARVSGFQHGSWRAHLNFQLRERFDSWVQRVFSHQVLVPSFRARSRPASPFLAIPLIVRREFLERPARESRTPKIGLLLSGSEFEKAVFLEFARTHGVPVVSPSATGAHFAPVPSHAGVIDQFDVVFTQGGLSSISECIARKKFVVVFPLKDHPEQILNAREVERRGLGLCAHTRELANLPRLMHRIERCRRHAHRRPVACNGAQVAARHLFRRLLNVQV